jgi:transcriptional regulator with XRE-family HTH domain
MGQSTTLELVGRRLREERTRCALSLDDAAGELGVHKSVLSRIENGERGLDSVLLRRAASLYEVPMDALFEEADTGLVVKARDLSDNLAGVDEMSRWAQRKLSELRFVRQERSGA